MIKNPRSEEEKIIKDKRNLFRLATIIENPHTVLLPGL